VKSAHLALIALAAAGLWSPPASAQQQSEAVQLSDAQVRHAIVLALRNINKTMCGEERCAPASAAEFENPPLSLADARAAIGVGVLAGTADWCGLDWRRGLFAPAMARFEKEAKPGVRQRALFALMEGIYQGQVFMALKPRGACPEEVKTRMQARLAKP
jgi:hypothetical protein